MAETVLPLHAPPLVQAPFALPVQAVAWVQMVALAALVVLVVLVVMAVLGAWAEPC